MTFANRDLFKTVRQRWRYKLTEKGRALLVDSKGVSPAILDILSSLNDHPAISLESICELMPFSDPHDVADRVSIIAKMELVEHACTAILLDEGAESRRIKVLLVEKDTSTRQLWRWSLPLQVYTVFEASSLDDVQSVVNQERPDWILTGLEGDDFNGCHLVKSINRPRSQKIAKSAFIVPSGYELSESEVAASRRADILAFDDGNLDLHEVLSTFDRAYNAPFSLDDPFVMPAIPVADPISMELEALDVALARARAEARAGSPEIAWTD